MPLRTAPVATVADVGTPRTVWTATATGVASSAVTTTAAWNRENGVTSATSSVGSAAADGCAPATPMARSPTPARADTHVGAPRPLRLWTCWARWATRRSPTARCSQPSGPRRASADDSARPPITRRATSSPTSIVAATLPASPQVEVKVRLRQSDVAT